MVFRYVLNCRHFWVSEISHVPSPLKNGELQGLFHIQFQSSHIALPSNNEQDTEVVIPNLGYTLESLGTIRKLYNILRNGKNQYLQGQESSNSSQTLTPTDRISKFSRFIFSLWQGPKEREDCAILSWNLSNNSVSGGKDIQIITFPSA